MPGKRVKILVYLFVSAIVIVAGVLYLGRSKPVKVVVQKVETGIVQRTVANTRAGTLKACRRAGISPSIGGQISKLPVTEGDQVKPGQVLMELWNEDRRAQVVLAEQEARAGQAKAKQACVVAEVAEKEASRLRKLQKQGIASEEATNRADGEARAQKAACKAARATAEVSQARLVVAQALLERTRLTAPFAGIVAEVNGEVGEFVTPSPVGVPTPPAVDLVDTSCLYVSAPIDEVDAPGIQVGMPANIALDAYKQSQFAGTVRRIAPYVLDVEKQARTVAVEVDFSKPEENKNMLPGYSADIEIILAEEKTALRIPTEAITDGNKVYVFQDGQLEEREVTMGLSNWAWSEIKSGLELDEEVVVSVDRSGVEDGATAKRDRRDIESD